MGVQDGNFVLNELGCLFLKMLLSLRFLGCWFCCFVSIDRSRFGEVSLLGFHSVHIWIVVVG